MKKEFRKNLQKGRIYLKQGKWVVRYVTQKKIKGGSPKQLGSYNTVTEAIYVPIRKEDTYNLSDPYSQGKETCFELILVNEPRDEFKEVRFVADTKPVWYAKLWSTSEMVQEFQHYLETTPQEKIDEDWKKVEEFDLVGPTVSEFLGIEEQPKMIPKSEMKEGWYNGHCRNAYMAYWNSKEQIFYYLSYSFNFYMDKIEHFQDVKDKRQDGFIPIERVERVNWVDINRIKEEVGY